jgi:hypothetical protein
MANQSTSKLKKEVEKGIPRPNLAELLQIPRGYRLKHGATLEAPAFVLVNESLDGPIKPSEVQLKKDYSRDELIALIGKAYREFTDLVKELDEVKVSATRCAEEAASAKVALLNTHRLITGLKEPEKGVTLDIEFARNIRHQAFDVLRSIAYGHSLTAEQMRDRALKMVEHAEKKGAHLLVNETLPDVQADTATGD